eukprot:1421413-Alexandrium_andersonii.AAC.1
MCIRDRRLRVSATRRGGAVAGFRAGAHPQCLRVSAARGCAGAFRRTLTDSVGLRRNREDSRGVWRMMQDFGNSAGLRKILEYAGGLRRTPEEPPGLQRIPEDSG